MDVLVKIWVICKVTLFLRIFYSVSIINSCQAGPCTLSPSGLACQRSHNLYFLTDLVHWSLRRVYSVRLVLRYFSTCAPMQPRSLIRRKSSTIKNKSRLFQNVRTSRGLIHHPRTSVGQADLYGLLSSLSSKRSEKTFLISSSNFLYSMSPLIFLNTES